MKISYRIILIIAIAVALGLLMGIRAEMPFAWQRALIAAVVFGVLGLFLSYWIARRKP